jgi:hypothetical protein
METFYLCNIRKKPFYQEWSCYKFISRSAHTNNQYESQIFTTNFLFIYFLSTFTGTEGFVPGHVLLPLSWDKGTPGQENFFVPRDVPSRGNASTNFMANFCLCSIRKKLPPKNGVASKFMANVYLRSIRNKKTFSQNRSCLKIYGNFLPV